MTRYIKSFWNIRGHYKVLILISAAALITPSSIIAATLQNQTGTLWAPYVEWSLGNSSYTGNPFDVIATVTFTHGASGETRTTEMFYAGGTSWKFRFAGTKTGVWTFTTASTDPELDGHTGIVTINSNLDPKIKGFLTSKGNKFAKQIGENGELEPFIFNVYQSNGYKVGPLFWYNNSTATQELDKAINEIQTYGFSSLYSGIIANEWFKLETQRWDEHSNVDPDLRTFEALELAISYLHSKGHHLHIWAWGDESRKQTPIGTGGINGIPDKRVQRYIAARLGSLPGWSMGYGFDLQEWVTEAEVGEWASYLHQHLGWKHMLWARGRSHSELDAKAYSGFGDYGFAEAKSNLKSDLMRPHLYSERFIYLRKPYWDMEGTRRKTWQYVLAGGMGSWWGWWLSLSPTNYSKPEQLQTFQRFWDKRFLLDMNYANTLTGEYALKTPSNALFVFYKENTGSIQMDLSGMNGTQTAVAIDTKKAYTEITLGTLSTTNQSWTAPYVSDWAIAIGDFDSSTPLQRPRPPTDVTVTVK